MRCIADAAGALNLGAVARAAQETLEPTLRAHAIAALQQRSRRRGVFVMLRKSRALIQI